MASDIPLSRSMEFEYGEPRELGPDVRRIVANNPSPFTFKGTNTYLIGHDQLAVIDPGPEDPAHLQAILAASGGVPISHIVLTHTHRDHCDGLVALQRATGAETWGMGPALRDDTATNGRRGTAETSPSGDAFTDTTFRPDHVLEDGSIIQGSDWSLAAVFTPGHAPDHMCFEHRKDGAPTGVFFSGDHVMGWSTSVIAPPEGNMGDYLRSLEKLLGRSDEVFLPGHGGTIRTPMRVVKAYMVHRKWRENAILDCVRGGTSTLDAIVAKSYPSLDETLIPAATLSVQAHLALLIENGAVSSCEREGGVVSFVSV